MTKEEFIEKWSHCDVTENDTTKQEFSDDIDVLIRDSWPKTFAGYNSDVNHMTICPQCHCFIMFSDDAVTAHSIGGQIIRRTVHCDCCNDEIPLYPWRSL